ncbi:MAG: DUF1080 domain-containing protein [Planctomycetes bacterium]|nr:DUF1080 domain-containing protein [Planctomycetota bacterium]
MRRACWFLGLTALVAMFAVGRAHAAEPGAPAAKPKADKPISEDVLKKVEAALPDRPCAPPARPRKMLILTVTKGFRHASIPLAAATLEMMGKKTGAWEATSTDDVSMLKAATLSRFDALCSDQCTGDVTRDAPDADEIKKSIVDFISGGKGLVGVHAATDVGGWNFPEFKEMMGGVFAGHPFRRISVKLDDPASPINAAFEGKGFEISDEIYTFKEPYSREKLRILISIDWENAGLKGGTRADNDYALSWIREYGKGRVFYCAFGHEDAIWYNPTILKHYLAGIQYALGDLKADATPSAKARIQPARGPVLPPQPEKAKPAAKPAPKVNQAPRVLHAPMAAAAAATVSAAPPPEPSGLKPDAQGWITLFDGKNLDAFQKPPADKWKIIDGVLTWEKGCGNLWTRDKLGDFVLDLEVKCEKGTNSGVFLRSAEGERNWLHGSIEIQVAGTQGDRKPGKHDLGSVYDVLAPAVAAEKPIGQWNRMVITFKGNSLQITLNDKPIINADLNQWTEAGMNPDGSKNKFKTAYKDMAKVGFLGLQDHGAPVWYRNIKVKPLSSAAAPTKGGSGSR